MKLRGANASLICNSLGLERCQRNQKKYFPVRMWEKQISIEAIFRGICHSAVFTLCLAKQTFSHEHNGNYWK